MSTTRRAARTSVIAALAALATTGLTGLAGASPAAEPELLWKRIHDSGPAFHDYAAALATGPQGIYVAGSSQDREHPADYTLVKYSLDKRKLWERHLGGTAERAGAPTDIALLPDGGVVVTGLTTHESATMITTARYAPSGRHVWTRHHRASGPFFGDGGPQVAVAPGDGSIRVSATLDGDFLVVAYEPFGSRRWSRSVDVSDGREDIATGVAVDAAGNAYVVGPSGEGSGGYSTAKVDAKGKVRWTDNVHGPFGSTLGPAFVEVAPDGAVVVSGTPETTCGVHQSRTWTLSPDGTERWQVAYPADPCDLVETVGMRVRADGSVVVLGTSLGTGGQYDLTTVSYDDAGELEWDETLDSGGSDLATAVDVDASGNAYVTGVGNIGQPANDVLTGSYDRAGGLRWVGEQDLADSQSERPHEISALDDGTVVVSGDLWTAKGLEDLFTLRYGPPAADR